MTITKLPTGIGGFDHISQGGLPKGRTTLLAGTAGSAKTVFASQFLGAGVNYYDECGVFVTFEEQPEDIRRNLISLGFDIAQMEAEGKWAFVDASPSTEVDIVFTGDFDFGALMARIESAIRRIGAQRVVIDSLGAIFTQFEDAGTVRRELFRVTDSLRKLSVTCLLTAERVHEYGDIARFGIEEFVADNVVILRNVLESEKRRRTIEVLKFRGAAHNKGEYPLTIVPESGIEVIPLSEIALDQRSSDIRVHSGSEELDAICSGGFFRDSIILVSGATGTGKTLLVTEFMKGGIDHNERCLLFGFEESRDQLFRNATGWGVDFAPAEAAGQLRVDCRYPETQGLEEHLVRLRDVIEEFKPNRVAIDSLSALERVSTVRGFREFVISITAFLKEKEITSLFTSTTPSLLGGSSITEAHISTITDSIILLRYVEMYGEMRRGLTVLKMRGSAHEKDIREIKIDSRGMHIGERFKSVVGILAGAPQGVAEAELERLEKMFDTP